MSETPRPEQRPMVFGIGLSKTGTHSLNAALCELGWPSVHYPDPVLTIAHRFDEAFAGYLGATDISVACVFEALDEAYPEAKFILTVRRDNEAWLDSVEAHYAKREDELSGDLSGPRYEARRIVYGVPHFDREVFAMAQRRHEDRVMAYFAGREDDLLVMDVCAGEGYERLCPFLGEPMREGSFPRRNARQAAA